MLRSIFARPRSIRVPLRNGPVDVQRVAIARKSKPSITRFLVTSFIGFSVVRTISYAFTKPDDKSQTVLGTDYEKGRKSHESHQQGAERQEHRNVQHSRTSASETGSSNATSTSPEGAKTVYFMLPLYFRQKTMPMYDESDSEWQEFVRLQGDKKRCTDVKKQVAMMVTKQLQKPQHVANLHHIQHNKRVGVMLDIVPPLYPPSLYEVPCLFIDTDAIRLGWRTLPNSLGSKMERIFHPLIFAECFGAGIKEFSILTFLITKARLLDWWQQEKEDSVVFDSRTTSSSSVANRDRGLSHLEKLKVQYPVMRISDKGMETLLPFLRGEYGKHASRQSFRNAVKSMTYKSAIEHACTVFNLDFANKQFAAANVAPRGACQVRGFIECQGERGRYRIEVIAIYMPSENAFIGRPNIIGAYIINDYTKWNMKKREERGPAPIPESETTPSSTSVNGAPQPSPQTATRPPSGKGIEK